MSYKAILLFGAPGAGKGTQGKILGAIPGFYHCACGDVFRGLDETSPFGQAFVTYSSKGQLVPDDITLGLWAEHLKKKEAAGKFHPATDLLVLDGIPRTVAQAKMLGPELDIKRVYHLDCPDRTVLQERLRRRAIKENRIDDASPEVIARRLQVYDEQTHPVLGFYGEKLITTLDASLPPYQILRTILNEL